MRFSLLTPSRINPVIHTSVRIYISILISFDDLITPGVTLGVMLISAKRLMNRYIRNSNSWKKFATSLFFLLHPHSENLTLDPSCPLGFDYDFGCQAVVLQASIWFAIWCSKCFINVLGAYIHPSVSVTINKNKTGEYNDLVVSNPNFSPDPNLRL